MVANATTARNIQPAILSVATGLSLGGAMRFALLVISHVLRLCGTLAFALGVGLFAFWVLDRSTFVESGSLFFDAVGAILAGGAALMGGRLLAQRRIGSEVRATPIITKPLE